MVDLRRRLATDPHSVDDELRARLDARFSPAEIVLLTAFGAIMVAGGRGVIVNNSSIAGLRGMARLSHYAASKWGLTGLTKSWAIELAPHGIRVNSIHPTGVDTPLNDGLAAMEGMTTQEIAERSAGNLLPVPGSRRATSRTPSSTSRARAGATSWARRW
jgi:NAD(P)-dependent dehydrogenase (short-subunit alcohol dehydrogenase family)